MQLYLCFVPIMALGLEQWIADVNAWFLKITLKIINFFPCSYNFSELLNSGQKRSKVSLNLVDKSTFALFNICRALQQNKHSCYTKRKKLKTPNCCRTLTSIFHHLWKTPQFHPWLHFLLKWMCILCLVLNWCLLCYMLCRFNLYYVYYYYLRWDLSSCWMLEQPAEKFWTITWLEFQTIKVVIYNDPATWICWVGRKAFGKRQLPCDKKIKPKETTFLGPIVKQENYYKTSNSVTKVSLKQKLVQSEHCQEKRSHSVLISAPWSTHEVFKAHWQRVPPILRCSDLAAASLSFSPLMTDPHENTVQDVLKNLPFQHLMNIWPHTAPVFNSIHAGHITK